MPSHLDAAEKALQLDPSLAEAHTWLGYVYWLAEANEQHSWLVVMWKVDPELDPLRSDPRFTLLLAKAGLDK